MEENCNKNRILWLDALKFIGIYTIYVAHFIQGAGNLYKYACMYVIQLFFFVSGCFAVSAVKKSSLKAYVEKQAGHLLLPYFLFSLLNILLIVIEENRGIRDCLPLIKQMLFGIRNQLFAPALWFLPCLFVVSVFYGILLKLLKRSGVTLLASFVIYGLAANLLPFDATETPMWFFNIDSAFFYLFFFALGAVCFPVMRDFKWSGIKEWSNKKKGLAGALGLLILLLSAAASVLTFFGRQDYFVIYPVFAKLPFLTWLYPVYIALGCIVVQVLLSLLLQRIPLICRLGRQTLSLCGNETIVKTLTASFLSLAGLGIQIATPLHAYVYGFILLILCSYVMIPVERKLFPKLCKS